MNSHNDQLPDGLIAQLIEHCTRITEVGISFKPEFFRLSFHYCSSNVNNYNDKHLNLLHLSVAQIYVAFIYINFCQLECVFGLKRKRANVISLPVTT